MKQPIFTGSSGLNTLVDPARLQADPAAVPLSRAYNVDHDATGRVSRRKGCSTTDITSAVHSLWCDGNECFFVTGTSLCRLSPDFSYDVMATVQGARTSYLQLDNRVYWVNGYEKGIIENGANRTWPDSSYSPYDTTITYSPVPTGTMLGYHGARILIVDGSTIWYTGRHHPYGVDKEHGYFLMENAVIMCRPVAEGVWVSDSTGVYFLQGRTMPSLKPFQRSSVPAISGTDIVTDLSVLRGFEVSGLGVLWLSKEGVCAGTADGTMLNLTDGKLAELPVSERGAGVVIGQRYVGVLQP